MEICIARNGRLYLRRSLSLVSVWHSRRIPVFIFSFGLWYNVTYLFTLTEDTKLLSPSGFFYISLSFATQGQPYSMLRLRLSFPFSYSFQLNRYVSVYSIFVPFYFIFCFLCVSFHHLPELSSTLLFVCLIVCLSVCLSVYVFPSAQLSHSPVFLLSLKSGSGQCFWTYLYAWKCWQWDWEPVWPLIREMDRSISAL